MNNIDACRDVLEARKRPNPFDVIWENCFCVELEAKFHIHREFFVVLVGGEGEGQLFCFVLFFLYCIVARHGGVQCDYCMSYCSI